MRKLQLMTTAAAMLALGASGAYAQNTKDEPPQKAPAAQRRAPAEKIAPAIKHSERKAPETTGQATQEPLHPGHGANTGLKQRPGAATDTDSGAKADVKSPKAGESTGVKAETKSDRSTTTGQGAAAGSAKLSTQQRTKITTILRQRKVAPVHLNVSVHIGARLPASVRFYPLPVDVISVYPEWRGYDYILVGEEILIVDPASHEIVAVLEA
jgi:hypothetical protein